MPAETCPKELKSSLRARTPVFPNQPSIQTVYCIAAKLRLNAHHHLDKICKGSVSQFCPLTSVGPVSGKVTAKVGDASVTTYHKVLNK